MSQQNFWDFPVEAADFDLGCGNLAAVANLKPGEAVLDTDSGGGLDAMLAAQNVIPANKVIGFYLTPEMIQGQEEQQ